MKSVSARDRRSWIKTNLETAFAFIHNRGFGADTLFIRTKTTVGARNGRSATTAYAIGDLG
jgi:hypothetical protein